MHIGLVVVLLFFVSPASTAHSPSIQSSRDSSGSASISSVTDYPDTRSFYTILFNCELAQTINGLLSYLSFTLSQILFNISSETRQANENLDDAFGEDSDDFRLSHMIKSAPEGFKKVLISAAESKDHRFVIRLLEVPGAERLFGDMWEEFEQAGKPEQDSDSIFFIFHCSICRRKAAQRVAEAEEELEDVEIGAEAISLFERGIEDEFNDLFLFMNSNEPEHIPRIEMRLGSHVGYFSGLLLYAAENKRRAGMNRLLSMDGAAQAIDILRNGDGDDGSGFKAELEFIDQSISRLNAPHEDATL